MHYQLTKIATNVNKLGSIKHVIGKMARPPSQFLSYTIISETLSRCWVDYLSRQYFMPYTDTNNGV